MMKLEFIEEFSGSSDQIIVKGKRTKRLRPSSSASSTGGGDFFNSFVSSPATTSSGISTTSEEDEDMAHCLILLAQGYSPMAVENKFSSRKISETATTSAGKVGAYVYECKTCNRAFPTFQALGGHRASHKRLKTAADDDQKKSPPPEEEEGQSRQLASTHSAGNRACHNDPKIHECSICGSEFGSGQALGGHMRRHRVAASITTSKPRNMLALDLNLPAPPEEQFPAKQGFSTTAALVDCLY